MSQWGSQWGRDRALCLENVHRFCSWPPPILISWVLSWRPFVLDWQSRFFIINNDSIEGCIVTFCHLPSTIKLVKELVLYISWLWLYVFLWPNMAAHWIHVCGSSVCAVAKARLKSVVAAFESNRTRPATPRLKILLTATALKCGWSSWKQAH